MAENSKIEWTDHTANLWWGCTEVHAGCDNCYAREWANRFDPGRWGNEAPRRMILSTFTNLAKWQHKAQKDVKIAKVFVGSMMDIFEKSKPLSNPSEEEDFHTTGDLRAFLFDQISKGRYNNLIFQFLTKRPSNINKMIPEIWKEYPPSNVWFGASVVDHKSMMQVARHMDKVNGVTFWSVEPLLEGISLDHVYPNYKMPNWLIVGGESGSNKRPFDVEWARKLRDECQMEYGVPFFMKQVDKVQPIPQDLMVREFPYKSKAIFYHS